MCSILNKNLEVSSVKHGASYQAFAIWAFSIWFPRVEVGSVGVNDLAIVVAVAVAIYNGRGGHYAYIGSGTRVFLFSAFGLFAISFIQLFWVPDTSAALRFSLRYLGICVLCASLHRAPLSERAISSSATSFVLGAIISSIAAFADSVWNVAQGVTYEAVSNRRSMGFLEHPNQFGIFLSVSIPLIFIASIQRKWKVVGGAVIALGMLLSGSKTNILLMIATIALCCMCLPGGRILKWGILIIAAVSVVFSDFLIKILIYLVAEINPGYAIRFQDAMLDPASASTLTERFGLWQTAVQLGIEYPAFGIGAGQAGNYLPYSHAHNFIFHYFMTMGIPGLIFILAIITGILFKKPKAEVGTETVYLKIAVLIFAAANLLSDSIAGRTIELLGFLMCMSVIVDDVSCLRRRRTGSQPDCGH